MKAQNTELWGMTSLGGSSSYPNGGVIFKINEDGSGFQALKSFHNLPNGLDPVGHLLKATNGSLYAMTVNGGDSSSSAPLGNGVLFNFNPVGNVYSDIMNFDTASGTGNQPNGSLIQATNGKLYGMTKYGGDMSIGNDGGGTLFSLDPTNNSFTVLINFNYNTGCCAFGSLLQANNGKLYGMTFGGGDTTLNHGSGYGVIFSYDILTNTYTKLFNFDNSNGANPLGNLIQATNGLLYGMTYYGGSDTNHWGNNNVSTGAGVIFSFDITNNTYTVVHNFDSAHGALPFGSLMQASNGLLYGMTSGTSGNNGNIFSLDPSSNNFIDLHDFNYSDGSGPLGDLIQASNGKLYGMTSDGGIDSAGTIFNYDISNNTYTKMFDFDFINGFDPIGSFIELPQGTGINELMAIDEQISVYPNPATTLLHIHQSLPSPNQQLIITDLLGNEVYTETLPSIVNYQLSIANWNAGLYFYEIRTEKGSERGKFVVQK